MEVVACVSWMTKTNDRTQMDAGQATGQQWPKRLMLMINVLACTNI